MRNMSFAMTIPQVQARTKTVTRRCGWWNLQPGNEVRAVEKAMGLRKGEKIKPLATLRIVSVRPEPLNTITQEDVPAEGFPDWSPEQFVEMLVKAHKIHPGTIVNRIEFEYL